jgi:hypothetical protein
VLVRLLLGVQRKHRPLHLRFDDCGHRRILHAKSGHRMLRHIHCLLLRDHELPHGRDRCSVRSHCDLQCGLLGGDDGLSLIGPRSSRIVTSASATHPPQR